MKRLTTVVALVLLVGGVTVTRAQSLGELAKKVAAEKAAKAQDGKTKPPTKAYTDQDLVAKDPLTTTAPGKQPEPTPVTESAATVVIADAAKREAYWRGRLAPLQEKLASDIKSADVVRDRLLQLRATLQPNRVSLAVFGPEMVRLTTEMNHWNVILDADLAAIADLKEEGRRAGAFPGWFR